jgi:hypothetical protein
MLFFFCDLFTQELTSEYDWRHLPLPQNAHSSPVFMIYDAITSRNLLVGPDCFYHLYFLLEIYFLSKHRGSSLPLVGVKEGCMLRCGDGHKKTQRLGLLTCGLERERERDRQTPTLKGFTTDFLVEGGWDFICWSISNAHTCTISEWDEKGKRGDTVCALKSMSYISKWWNWKGTVGVLYPFASNIQITSLKWTSTEILLLFQEHEKLYFLYS